MSSQASPGTTRATGAGRSESPVPSNSLALQPKMIGIARGFPIYGNKGSAGDLDNRAFEAVADPLSGDSDLGPRPNRGRPRGALPRAGDFRYARWGGGRDDRPRRPRR